MKHDQFDAACREIFHGWSGVETRSSPMGAYGGHMCILTISNRALEAARVDRSALVARLFSKARIDDLVRVIERNQGLRGLRWYGRKRR